MQLHTSCSKNVANFTLWSLILVTESWETINVNRVFPLLPACCQSDAQCLIWQILINACFVNNTKMYRAQIKGCGF